MIIIHADLNVLPDKKEAFLEAVKPLIRASQAENGCIRYTLMHEVGEEKLIYTFVEEWKDQAALDFHNATDHFITFDKLVPSLTSGKTMKVLTTTDTK
ncbi:putative quinol monooxygenase [Paenibacillus sp. FSL M7-1046]|uniref:putative quinol monooxygenase n=1 Tax=Paenibacillus sp. FSL M7-1046 TaxID=2975315 RepID=UPI0030FB6E02